MMTIEQIELMIKETSEKVEGLKKGIEERLKSDPENPKIQDELVLVNKMIEQAEELKRIMRVAKDDSEQNVAEI